MVRLALQISESRTKIVFTKKQFLSQTTPSSVYQKHSNSQNCISFPSASDAIVAVVSLPITFAVFMCDALPDDNPTVAMLYTYIDMLPSVLSIYSLGLISLDRAFAVALPYCHGQ